MFIEFTDNCSSDNQGEIVNKVALIFPFVPLESQNVNISIHVFTLCGAGTRLGVIQVKSLALEAWYFENQVS